MRAGHHPIAGDVGPPSGDALQPAAPLFREQRPHRVAAVDRAPEASATDDRDPAHPPGSPPEVAPAELDG